MMRSTEISVVMPVYNTNPKWLRESIESILDQTYEDFEFIIILDAPTDDSEMIVEEYANKDERIRIIKNEINKGITESLNIGIRESKTGIIARMDSDDIAMRDRLLQQYKYLTTKRMHLIGSRIIPIGNSGEDTGLASVIVRDKKIKRILKYANIIPHPTWMMRKELFDALGGYREVFACEDYDFLLRAVEQKASLGMCDEILLKYRLNPESISMKSSLPQFLMSRLLQNKGHVEDEDIAKLREMVLKKSTESERRKFAQTISIFGRAVREIRQMRILRGTCSLIKASISSKYAPAYVFNSMIARAMMIK